jgi:hypothetical protein
LNDADEMQARLSCSRSTSSTARLLARTAEACRGMVEMRAWREMAVGTFVSWDIDTGLGQRSTQVAY